MNKKLKIFFIQGLRSILIIIGFIGATILIYSLATLPQPPENSEGFVTGLAYFFGTIFTILFLGLISIGIALPTLLGQEDILGFNQYQRWLLIGTGIIIGLGLLFGFLLAILVGFQLGFLILLIALFISIFPSLLAIIWLILETGYSTIKKYKNNNLN